MSYGSKVSISNTRSLDSRYDVYGEIASGGMASVQYGRLFGPRGFSRAVAIKRLHPHLSKDPEFTSMFLDEARLSARLMHANIVHTLDVIETPGEVALVMEYVHGESLWMLERLCRAHAEQIPLRVGCAIMVSVLHGLHAAHETLDDNGELLHVVHRDVSPQNILIGADGVPRILDFGIAKAMGRVRDTKNGEIKGKLGYISTEQLQGEEVCRRTDVYGAAVVLWEVLTGTLLFDGPSEQAVVQRVLSAQVAPPSQLRPEVSAGLDEITLRGLSRDRNARYATAQEMAVVIEREVGLATQSEVASWLRQVAGDRLDDRVRFLTALQDGSGTRPHSVTAAHATRRIPSSDTPVVDSGVVPSAATVEVVAEPGSRASGSAPAPVAVERVVPVPHRARGRSTGMVAGFSVLIGVAMIGWLLLDRPHIERTPPQSAALGLLNSKEEPPPRVVDQPDSPPPKAAAADDVAPVSAPELSTLPTPVVSLAPELPLAPEAAVTALAPTATQAPLFAESAESSSSPAVLRKSNTARARDKLKTNNKMLTKLKQASKAAAHPVRARDSHRHSKVKTDETRQDPCIPFYEVDEHGIRRPKPECL